MAVGDMIRSPVWGNKDFEITQEFGTYDPDTAHMYPADYTESLGFPAGTHIGLDIGMPRGTPIFAANPGTVEFAGFSDSFRPNPVHIKTQDNPDTPVNEKDFVEIYGHLWQNMVATGDTVRAGKQIGISGEQTVRGTMNPDGTGPHLHFELRRPGANTSSGMKAVHPRNWLTGAVINDSDIDPEPDNPDEIPSTNILDNLGLPLLLETLKEFSQRGFIAVIGLAVLIIGLNSVLKSSGFSAGKTIRNAIPAARLAKRLK